MKQPSGLSLVDLSGVGQTTKYPLSVLKFRKGNFLDEDGENALLKISFDPTLKNKDEKNKDDLPAFLSYNDRCVWTDKCN